MLKKIALSLMISSSFFVGCTSTKIPEQKGIVAPVNATNSSIEASIRQAVGTMNRRGWVVESSSPEQVVVGLNNRGHYLQVTYSIVSNRVSSKITNSQNLNQGKNSIHKNAIRWKQGLDQRVFAQISQIR